MFESKILSYGVLGGLSRRRLLLLAKVYLLTGCLFSTHSPPESEFSDGDGIKLSYTVYIRTSPKPTCEIIVKVDRWPPGHPMLFQLPRFYADNPQLPTRDLDPMRLEVRDGHGLRLLRDSSDLTVFSGEDNLAGLPAVTRSIRYQVDLAPEDPMRFGIPMPGLAPGVQMLDGAYFFILPVVTSDYSGQWRLPIESHVEFVLEDGVVLSGQEKSTHFRNNYELMFVRAAINPWASSTFFARNHRVTTYKAGPDSVDLQAMNILLARCIGIVEDSLLELPTYTFFVGTNSVFWGVEGFGGYWIRPEAYRDPVVHLHELVHTFVGVRMGDRDEPWWKEGLTNYVGRLMAVQNGFLPDSIFRAQMTQKLDSIPAVMEYALRDGYLRDHLFTPLDSAYGYREDKQGFISLVYEKGAQASMILDRYILEKSDGKYSVYTLIRDLYRKHAPLFTRGDMVRLVANYTFDSTSGSSAETEAFLTGILEMRGSFGQDSLTATVDALARLNRLGAKGAGPAGPAVKRGARDWRGREDAEGREYGPHYPTFPGKY